MKQKTFQVPSKKQPVWKVVSKLLKGIYKKPQILNLNEEISEKSILVANHSAMNGPVVYSLYFPLFHATLGAYQMLGNYKSRFRYLRDVYYVQKRGMKKFPATLIASFEAIFSIFFYRGMKVLPSYDDARVVTTIKNSIACIDANVPVMIFPEDSSTGYHEKLKSFFPGFVGIAERYRKLHNGEDVNIYPIYYHKEKNKMVIGKPAKLSDYEGMDRYQIADAFCKKVNDLFEKYVNVTAENSTNL